MRRFFTTLLLLPVYFYKYCISPMTPASCRYTPTCSEYAVQALKKYGPVKGLYLAVKRILRCHPWVGAVMIRFRNAMGYCDIHTHQMPFHKEDIAVINRIVSPMGDMQPGSLPDTVIRSYGIHPWYIYNVKEQMDLLRVLVSGSGVVAIGEAGLDTLAESPMDLQKEVFLAQANLAEETHKPLIIHCVKAWADLIACKKAVKPEMPWIIHGFRGNGELASQLVRLGFYLSFGDRFNPSALRAAWPDFLFLETDDKSIDIRGVYQNVAEALDIPEEKLRIQIAKNVSIFHLNG